MAKFTRAEIRAIIGEGCTSAMEDALVALHRGVVDPIRDELVEAKAAAEQLPETQKELREQKQKAKEGETWKTKFEELTAQTTAKETRGAKERAYEALLRKAGVSEKRLRSILKVTDFDAIELDETGAIKGAGEVEKSIKTEWADFVTTTETHGADVTTPPEGARGRKYTDKAEILKIEDTAERQRAIAENHDLFGF